MTEQNQPRHLTLYFRQGAADKVYRVSLEPAAANGAGPADRFVVRFAFGRRGATLQTGIKTPAPVPHAEALALFHHLVQQKTRKGYTPGEDGVPYAHTEHGNRATGVFPQLLNAIEDEHRLAELLLDPLYGLQEKKDGQRLLLRKRGHVVEGINRRGLLVALPEPMVHAARALDVQELLLDGEAVGDTLHVFDVLECAGMGQRHLPYAERLRLLAELLAGPAQASGHLVRVITARTAREKTHLFARLQRENREGVCLKNLTAPYTPGRHPGRGDALKFKFVASASCVVTRVNPHKRSVGLGLYDGAEIVHAGNVSIPVNHEVPAAGSIVEVRYLFAHPQSGVLFQPCYRGPREDVEPSECVVAQLKYRPETETFPVRF